MNELSIQTCFKFVGIGVNCRQCRIIVTVCGATNEGRLFRWTIFLHIIFFSQILLEQNQGRDFPDFRLPHNVCDRWRCNQPMEGEGDDSSVGREGEKEGGLLLNYSISGDHPGLILYRDDEDVKLSKRFDRWCLFSIVCYVPFLGVLLGTD